MAHNYLNRFGCVLFLESQVLKFPITVGFASWIIVTKALMDFRIARILQGEEEKRRKGRVSEG